MRTGNKLLNRFEEVTTLGQHKKAHLHTIKDGEVKKKEGISFYLAKLFNFLYAPYGERKLKNLKERIVQIHCNSIPDYYEVRRDIPSEIYTIAMRVIRGKTEICLERKKKLFHKETQSNVDDIETFEDLNALEKKYLKEKERLEDKQITQEMRDLFWQRRPKKSEIELEDFSRAQELFPQTDEPSDLEEGPSGSSSPANTPDTTPEGGLTIVQQFFLGLEITISEEDQTKATLQDDTKFTEKVLIPCLCKCAQDTLSQEQAFKKLTLAEKGSGLSRVFAAIRGITIGQEKDALEQEKDAVKQMLTSKIGWFEKRGLNCKLPNWETILDAVIDALIANFQSIKQVRAVYLKKIVSG